MAVQERQRVRFPGNHKFVARPHGVAVINAFAAQTDGLSGYPGGVIHSFTSIDSGMLSRKREGR